MADHKNTIKQQTKSPGKNGSKGKGHNAYWPLPVNHIQHDVNSVVKSDKLPGGMYTNVICYTLYLLKPFKITRLKLGQRKAERN